MRIQWRALRLPEPDFTQYPMLFDMFPDPDTVSRRVVFVCC